MNESAGGASACGGSRAGITPGGMLRPERERARLLAAARPPKICISTRGWSRRSRRIDSSARRAGVRTGSPAEIRDAAWACRRRPSSSATRRSAARPAEPTPVPARDRDAGRRPSVAAYRSCRCWCRRDRAWRPVSRGSFELLSRAPSDNIDDERACRGDGAQPARERAGRQCASRRCRWRQPPQHSPPCGGGAAAAARERPWRHDAKCVCACSSAIRRGPRSTTPKASG